MNKVVKNTFVYTLGGLLNPLLGFLLLPLYTRYLNPNEYGIIAAIYSLIILFKVFYSFSLERSLMRLYWDYKTDYQRRLFLSTVSFATIGIAFLMSGISALFFKPIQQIFPEIPAHPFYIIALIMVNEQIIFNIIQNVYRIKEKANSFVLLTASHFLLKTILIILFVAIYEEGISGYFYAELITSLLFLLIYIPLFKSFFVIKFNKVMFFGAFRFSFPYLPGLTGSWIIGQSAIVFITATFSLAEAGIYAISTKIASILQIFDSSFKNAYLPHYFKIASTKSMEEAIIELKKFNNSYIQALFFIGFSIAFLSKEIVEVLLNSKYERVYLFIPLLTISMILSAFSGTIFGAAIQQSKKTMVDSGLGLITAILNLTLNYFLIKSFGLYGAAFSRLISMIFLVVIFYIYIKKRAFFIPFNWYSII
ncbi:MAG: O-antigen/teichoic acid export membrane protein, partial [bacterium]